MADGSPPRHSSTLPREPTSSSDQTNLARGSSMPAVRDGARRKNIHNISFPTYSSPDGQPRDTSRARLATEDVGTALCLVCTRVLCHV